MRAVVFPGQGAQCIGMGGDLFDRYADLTAQADEVLGFSLRALCLDDPARLNATRYTQPALFVVCYLRYLDYEVEHGPPAILAGHSVGEYAALAAANAIEFVDALKLVDSRARIMADIGGGAMAALVGPSRSEACALVAEFGAPGLEIANENSPSQTVVSGLMDEVTGFVDFCKSRQIRAVKLNVSGAFHSRHMRPAAERFSQVLKASKFHAPRIPVVSNVTAQLHRDDPGHAMGMHLYSPVLWTQSVDFMLDFGVGNFVEIGPRSILTPLIEEVKALRLRTGKPAVAAGPPPMPAADGPEPADSMLGPLRCHGAIADTLGWFIRQAGDLVLSADHCTLRELVQVREALGAAGMRASRLALYVDAGHSTGRDIAPVLERADALGASRLVLGGSADPARDLNVWFEAKRRSPRLRLVVLCNSFAAARRLLEVPAWRDNLESICLDGLSWADTRVSQSSALDTLREMTHGGGVRVGARPARICPEDTASLRKGGAGFVLSAGPYALVDDVAAPSGHRLRPPASVGADGRLPEFGSTSVLATQAPGRASLDMLSGLYRTPPREPGRLHRHRLELIERLAAERLPCVVAPAPLAPDPRSVRRYLRETMRLVHAAISAASPADCAHAKDNIESAEKWWNETHDPTPEKLYAWIWAGQIGRTFLNQREVQ